MTYDEHSNRPPRPPDNRKDSTKDLALIFPAHLAAHSAKLRSMRVYPSLCVELQWQCNRGRKKVQEIRLGTAAVQHRLYGGLVGACRLQVQARKKLLPSHLLDVYCTLSNVFSIQHTSKTHEQVPDLYLGGKNKTLEPSYPNSNHQGRVRPNNFTSFEGPY